ncbi:MAG: bifunctional diaminohydroxyphosphoribosylaminopyrimidine deaminase/5-amino-6-(5-phosphoribosylamino)uracil reductase RibD [Verrucomicrobia bacterium]|nr:bifunctional diaminohydroxyphosphoribosylaminopyrimidine deaminase/5-amino-6-(5-phosphoribosylamino)uracil reductase RibD [Verrucomicrobiota bacterium]
MRRALELAAKGRGHTSPNPMVGAVLVDANGQLLGEGWHHRAGEAHAEVNAIADAVVRGNSIRGATLYVTLEPCSTTGRTGPCVEAILKAGIARVICAATDPNPAHQGRGLELLRQAGAEVVSGVLSEESRKLNRAFNHWIVKRTPFVTLKSAMSLDGKIATAEGESRWITGEVSRRHAMEFRVQVDAILVGVNTVQADDCALTVRLPGYEGKRLRRIVLDSQARTPLTSKIVSDERRSLTTIVVSENAPVDRVRVLRQNVEVWQLPADAEGRPRISCLLEKLGSESVTHLLVEGGATVADSFLRQGFVHRIHFYYAPRIIGGQKALSSVSGKGVKHLSETPLIQNPEWMPLGDDFLLMADVAPVSR